MNFLIYIYIHYKRIYLKTEKGVGVGGDLLQPFENAKNVLVKNGKWSLSKSKSNSKLNSKFKSVQFILSKKIKMLKEILNIYIFFLI